MKMSFWHCCLYCSLSLFIVHCKHAMLLQYCRCTGSQMAAETFNSLLKSNPGSQTHWYSPWPLRHDICIDLLRKKLYITCHILQPGSSWISRPNLFSVHIIALDIDLSWNVFNLYKFCSMLIEQLINLRKVRTENLKKIRTDLWDWAMDGCH